MVSATAGLVNDVGGIFNFIPSKPEDTVHTKEKELWKRRFRSGMCLHCGQKIFKTKLRWGRKKFTPLNIPGFVNNGVCMHPNCNPPKKVTQDYSSDTDIDVTTSNDVDSLLDAVEENRNDIENFFHEMQKADKENKESAAIMLEEAVMQLNRTMSQLTEEQEARLLIVKDDLSQEIDAAQTAINSLGGRISNIEGVMSTMKQRIHDLEDRTVLHEIRSEELQAEINELRAQLERSNPEPPEIFPNKPPPQTSPTRETDFFLSTVAETKPIDLLHDFPNKKRYKCSQTLKNNQNGVICCASVDDGKSLVYSGNSHLLKIVRRQSDGSFDDHFPQMLEGHRDWIMCCAVASNSDKYRTLVSGGNDNRVIVWRREPSGKYNMHESISSHESSIHCCAISSDGSLIVSGSKDKTISIWLRQKNDKYMCTQVLIGHKDSVECCLILNDGAKIVSGSSDRSLKTWKRQASGLYECEQTLFSHYKSVMCCSATEDGSMMLSGGHDQDLVLWKRQRNDTYKHLLTLKGHQDWINCCAILHEGQTLLSGGDDNVLRIWRRQPDGTYECRQALKRHENYVYCCTVIDGEKTLVTGGNDGTIKVWELQARENPSL
jgi:WD40 repeat protein